MPLTPTFFAGRVLDLRIAPWSNNDVHRFFTPQEANAVLADVRALFEQASQKHKRMQNLIEGVQEGRLESGSLVPELDRLRQEIDTLLAGIENFGVEVKGMDTQLLDFPALRDGRPVYLCWHAGEDSVGWWHPLHTGFQGRQRLDDRERARWEWRN